MRYVLSPEHLEYDFRNIDKKSLNVMSWHTHEALAALAGEQNKQSVVTDHAISLNHVIDWDQAKVIDKESNRVDRWVKEATDRSDEGCSRSGNVNVNQTRKPCCRRETARCRCKF